VPALDPTMSSAGSTGLPLPTSISPGTYYVIANADADGAVAETQELNNTTVRLIQIGSDLTVSALTVPPKAGAHTSIVVSDTTTNAGSGAAGASVTRFYLSTNALLDAGDPLLAGSRPVPALIASGSSVGTTTVVIRHRRRPGSIICSLSRMRTRRSPKPRSSTTRRDARSPSDRTSEYRQRPHRPRLPSGQISP
jgi:hypothetical protein